MAPDILHAGLNEGYSLNVDMFSIGVVVYTVLCGYEPFFGNDDQVRFASCIAAPALPLPCPALPSLPCPAPALFIAPTAPVTSSV